jgi:hypothetical protein
MSGSKLSENSKPDPKPESPAQDQPLGLTVHSMPMSEPSSTPGSPNPALGRWKMILVMAVCAAPVIASYFTYYVVRPEGRRNFGELISPQVAMPALQATQLDGRSLPLVSLKGQWLLISVGSGACDPACVQQLYFQRQLRESLGREKDRLDRVWLIPDDAAVPEALLLGLKEATLLRLRPEQIVQWLAPQSGHALSEHLYVVDPMGNWMMRFPANLDAQAASKAKRDLDRLLRASGSWDEAGRLTQP